MDWEKLRTMFPTNFGKKTGAPAAPVTESARKVVKASEPTPRASQQRPPVSRVEAKDEEEIGPAPPADEEKEDEDFVGPPRPADSDSDSDDDGEEETFDLPVSYGVEFSGHTKVSSWNCEFVAYPL